MWQVPHPRGVGRGTGLSDPGSLPSEPSGGELMLTTPLTSARRAVRISKGVARAWGVINEACRACPGLPRRIDSTLPQPIGRLDRQHQAKRQVLIAAFSRRWACDTRFTCSRFLIVLHRVAEVAIFSSEPSCRVPGISALPL